MDQTLSTSIFDCLIIGGGPAGMTAAIFAQAKNIRVVIIDGGKAGGQLINLYPYKPVYNYPGYSRIAAGELAQKMIQQVKEHGIPLVENWPIERITQSQNSIFSVIGKKGTIRSKSILLASGLGLSEPRRLDADGEAELQGRGIEYSITDIADWSGREVAVFGGGNSAIDNALLLLEHQAHVTLIHRSDQLRAEPESISKLQKHGVSFYFGWKPAAFANTQDGKIKIDLLNSEKREHLVRDKALINVGLKPNTEFLESLDIKKEKRQVVVDTEMHTSQPGIFGCGDAVTYPGKVRLIVTALGEAATAINSLQHYLKSLAILTKESDVAHEG